MTALQSKLNVARFQGMSRKMAAMVEAILQPEHRVVNPALGGLSITSDGFVLAFAGPPVDHSVFLGSASDLEVNWKGLLDAAGLDANERLEAERLFAARVRDWRTL